jgi:outer membrane receptor protein involved in Fe transport
MPSGRLLGLEPFLQVPSNFIIDLSARYHISEYISLMGNVINVLDKEYAVSRVPAGLRPGHPLELTLELWQNSKDR